MNPTSPLGAGGLEPLHLSISAYTYIYIYIYAYPLPLPPPRVLDMGVPNSIRVSVTGPGTSSAGKPGKTSLREIPESLLNNNPPCNWHAARGRENISGAFWGSHFNNNPPCGRAGGAFSTGGSPSNDPPFGSDFWLFALIMISPFGNS